MRRVRPVSISSQLLMCGRGVYTIVLLLLVARCIESIDVCIRYMLVFMYVVVTVKSLLCSGKNSEVTGPLTDV